MHFSCCLSLSLSLSSRVFTHLELLIIYEWRMNRTVSYFLPPFIWGRTIDSLSSYSVFLCSLFKAALLLSSSSYSGSACLLSGVTLLLGTMSEHIQLSIALCRIGFYTVSRANVSVHFMHAPVGAFSLILVFRCLFKLILEELCCVIMQQAIWSYRCP